MRVLVCGGRYYGTTPRQRELIYATLDEIAPKHVLEGGASGADARAREWCRHHKIANTTFPADWEGHGKAAGPIRNKQMLTEGKPDIVVAFPGGRGTANMIAQAQAAGVPVREIQERRTAPRQEEGR
jgi:hypothetical protein